MGPTKSTLPNDEREAQDASNNPGEKAYQNGIGAGYTGAGLDQLEAYANDPTNHDGSDSIRDKEMSGDDSLSGGLYKPSLNPKKKLDIRATLKGKGAIGTILGLVLGTGLGFSALLSPSLLIVHMKEVMAEKFNTQLTSMDARTTKLLNAKVTGSTSGICNGPITIKCKFSTMSAKQVQNFKNAGIDVEPTSPNAGTRTKPTSYKWKGETITATQFVSLSKSDGAFRLALRKAYNPTYAGLSGKAWASAAKFLGISKRPVDLDGATNEERMKKLNTVAQEGTSSGTRVIASDFETEACDAECAEIEAEKINTTANDLEEDGKSGNAGKKAAALLSGTPVNSVTNAVKITGVVDNYCQAYGAISAVGYAAKTIRAIQLARYAIVFVTAADEIKATGELSGETSAFLGGVLTEVTRDAAGAIKSGSATDSFGYKYAAFGDTTGSKSSTSIANRFLAGGGFTGDLINFSNEIQSFFPGGRQGARDTCGTLANPIVGGASLVVGVAALFIPGANVGKTIANASANLVVSLGLALLPALLADIVAGTTTADIEGESSGNAITAGIGKTLSDTVAGLNGNGLMNKTDAAAYLDQQQTVAASYGKDESIALSPLDPTNQYTFLGSITSKLIPVASSATSGSSFIASFGNLLTTSFASIVPTTSAETSIKNTEALEICKDLDSIEAGYAVDPFCNVIRGIPLQYLDKDPLTVVDELISSGDLDAGTQLPTKQYQDFIDKCINTTDAPGYKSDGDIVAFSAADAKDCIISDANSNKFLNYLDTRVQAGMDGEDTEDATTTADPDTTDKVALAQKIVAKGKVTYLGVVRPTLEEIANGTTSPDAVPCGININILKIIDAMTDAHSIKISDMNRYCEGSMPSSTSRHYVGNGSALDIATADGVVVNGRNAKSIELINIAMPFLSAAASAAGGSPSRIGQKQCGTAVTLAAGVGAFNDYCNHLHLDVAPNSDPTLLYVQAGVTRGGGM